MSTSFEINWKLAARPERLSTTMRPATKLAVNLERIYRRKRATLVAWLPPVAVSLQLCPRVYSFDRYARNAGFTLAEKTSMTIWSTWAALASRPRSRQPSYAHPACPTLQSTAAATDRREGGPCGKRVRWAIAGIWSWTRKWRPPVVADATVPSTKPFARRPKYVSLLMRLIMRN